MRMTLYGLYLENVCINDKVISFVAQYFSIKGCAQSLLASRIEGFPWRQITLPFALYVAGAKLTDVTIGKPFDLWSPPCKVLSVCLLILTETSFDHHEFIRSKIKDISLHKP